ncbi:hypothetical protein BKM31_22325 [[Actinomadura] parvosata subsp. kistnae]|uniref:Uncharacterized protein n=1 Tax=[Actinomadura] parvosata subsp. kistnae TaxID=1909395 RepID=A0A1V0A0T7_9ACTN|nr:hypothetical protein BKM31_22325 [Nonomuraea sp. ATCC 55076]
MRTALIAGSAAVAVTVVTLAATLLLNGGERPAASPPPSPDQVVPELPEPSPEDLVPVTATLPASGVGPVRYAYYDFCQDKWKPGEDNAPVADETCLQWKVVLPDGTRYRVADALSIYTDQTKKNYMNTAAPLAISQDGRRIAYYDPRRERFAVRELGTGQVWEIPRHVERATMVKNGALIAFSPDGSRLGLNLVGRARVVVDVESGQVVEKVPGGWYFLYPADEGVPMVVERGNGRFGVLADGAVKALRDWPTWMIAGTVSPDGTTVALLTGPARQGEHMTSGEPYDKIVTVDRVSGQVASEVGLDAPPNMGPYRLGQWLNAHEVLALGGTAPVPGDGRLRDMGETRYAIDVTTGKVRELDRYRLPPWGGSVSAPGFPG